MSLFDIGVVFPSRGLLYTETFKELMNELSDYPHRIYWSHGNSLPACFNKPLTKALKGSHSHIWFVEDDMVLKPGILKELLEADEDIIACDYPIAAVPSGTILYDQDDEAIFTGTGCMLARSGVLVTMPKPIFRSDIEWHFKQYGDKVRFVAHRANAKEVYGHHDITFGLYQYVKRKPIAVAKTVLSQRKLRQKGETKNNIGTDDIVLFDKYKKINAYLIDAEVVEEPNSRLTAVVLDGATTLVTHATARRLIAEGIVTLSSFGHKNIIVDTNLNKKAIRYFKELL